MLAERLAERPLLLDGAMGTLLYSRGVPQRASLDELVLQPTGGRHGHPPRVHRGRRRHHRDRHVQRQSRPPWRSTGLADRTALINRRAAQLAREAREVAGRDVLVAGSIGPISSPLHGPGHLPAGGGRRRRRAQLEGLLEGGIDLRHGRDRRATSEHLLAAVEAARRGQRPARLASVTFGEDLRIADGILAGQAAAALHAAGVDVLGVNCGSGPLAAIDVLEQMRDAARQTPRCSSCPTPACRDVSAASSSGLPRLPTSGMRCRASWPRMPASWAAAAGRPQSTSPPCAHALDRELARRRGVASQVGRTTDGMATPGAGPADQRRQPAAGATRPCPRSHGPAATSDASERRAPSTVRRRREPSIPSAAAHRSRERPRQGRFVISVEIDPPRSVRIERTLQSAELIRDAGADLVNISDSAMARVRMGALAVGFAIQRELGPRGAHPLHDPRPQPHGPRVGAAGRPRPGRPRHPGADG